MSTVVVTTTTTAAPPPPRQWNTCLLVTDIVMCLLVVIGCLVGLTSDWASVELEFAFGSFRMTSEKEKFTLKDLRDVDSSEHSNTESAAKAATAFLALLIVCAAVVGVLAIVWIVSPSSGLRFYPLTTVPISLFGILSIAMTAWSWGALLDDSEDAMRKRGANSNAFTITVAAEAGGILALIAGVLACILGIVKCSALCCCRPVENSPSVPYGGNVAVYQATPIPGVPVAQQQHPDAGQQHQMQPAYPENKV